MSLQDQLLKAGLVDAKKASKIKKSKHQQAKQKQKNKVEPVDEARLAAQKAQAEKAERDRQLNLERKQEAERKAVAAQIRQLVEMNRQNAEGEIAYNFTDEGAIKRLYIDEEQQKQLGNGRLCIIKLDEAYEIIPTAVADKIHQRDESVTILSNQPTETPDEEDDYYADFKVPDDLMW